MLVSGEIPRWTKEIVFAAISAERNCHYCEAAHLACCRMLGVNPGTLEEMARDVDNISDPNLKTMVHFALKCARDPQSLTPADYDSLNDIGMTRSGIVELIAMAGLAVYANIMADATQMEPDAMFATVGVA